MIRGTEEPVLATDVVIVMVMMRDDVKLLLNEGSDHLLIHVFYRYWKLGSLFLIIIINCICIFIVMIIFTIKSERKSNQKS